MNKKTIQVRFFEAREQLRGIYAKAKNENRALTEAEAAEAARAAAEAAAAEKAAEEAAAAEASVENPEA